MAEVGFSYVPYSAGIHVVRAEIDGKRVGELSWRTDRNSYRNRRPRGEVLYIEVHPDFRRQGIATGMWHWAKSNCEETPVHSRQRSADGRAWVASMTRPRVAA